MFTFNRVKTILATAVATTLTAALPALALAAPVALTNAGFEADGTASFTGSDNSVTFYYRPTGPDVGWTFGGLGGVVNNYAFVTAFEGSRFGLLQVGNATDPFGPTGTTISQSFNLASASDVDLSFELALRPIYQPGQHVQVAIDGQLVGDFTTALGWHLKELHLGSLSAGMHLLAFAGTGSYGQVGDTTAFIDDVRLNTVAAVDNAVPVPATGLLALLGLGALGLSRSRRRVE